MGNAQLRAIDSFIFPVRTSAGSEERARIIAERADRALRWLSDVLGARPALRLSVPNEQDWPDVAPMPLYGVPQTWDDHVIVAAGSAPFFRENVDEVWPHLSEVSRARMQKRYGDPPDLLAFYDLILVHELTHLFHEQTTFFAPELWLLEFHANLGLVGYLHEVEPEQWPNVADFVACAVDLPASAFPATALVDMGESIERGGPLNYVWYELHLTAAADRVWQSHGARALKAIFDHFLNRPEGAGLTPAELDRAHPALAQIAAGWPGIQLHRPTGGG